MRLVIQKPGTLTTVQDLGRWGHQALGMPVSGAMDAPALARGNLLLGNPAGAAALEVTLMGPTVLFEDGEGAVAITGGDLAPRLNGARQPASAASRVARLDSSPEASSGALMGLELSKISEATGPVPQGEPHFNKLPHRRKATDRATHLKKRGARKS